jgi:hypothetical protein
LFVNLTDFLSGDWVVINIILGIIFIVGGLFGNLTLRGTHSGPALAVVGVILVVLGVVRLKGRQS